MRVVKRFIAFFLALHIAACTWVDVSPQGEKVRVLTASEVTSCKHVGKTTVMTKAKVAGLGRHGYKVQSELNTLARNSAIGLGGDAVVPVGAPIEGRQIFEVYRCAP